MAVQSHVVAQVDDLKDGEMTQVEAGEVDILLARVDGRYYATGAHCTHYGAPLADGVLSGDRIVCPWHHACFNVTTGRQEAPPGMDGLPRFEVEVRGQDVVVQVPSEHDPHCVAPMASRDASDTRVYAILGGGAAGAYAVEALREAGYAGRIVLITKGEVPPIDRPNLSKAYLSGEAPEEWMPLRDAGFYDTHAIEIMSGSVTEVDAASKRITFEDGRTLAYDKLLLCTGSTPRTLSVQGGDLPGVHTLRSMADSRALRERAENAQHAVVVGASFIGMEAAWSLREQGLDVTVVAPDAVPFASTFGEEVGRALQQIHEANGVQFKLGARVEAISGTAHVEQVHLSDGTSVETNLVVVGIGVRPETAYLKEVEVTPEGGVAVDEHFEAADDLYAAGDIAHVPYWRTGRSVRIEHWRTACQQGRLAGYAMAGDPRPFEDVPFFWTTHFGTHVRYVGHADGWDELTILGDLGAASFLAFYVEDGTIQAVLGVGRDREMAAVHELMRRDALPALSDIRSGTVQFVERVHLVEADGR